MGMNESTMGALNKGEKPKISIKNNQQKSLLLDKHRHFEHTFSFGYSLFFSLKITSPLLLHVLLLFTLLCLPSRNLLSPYSWQDACPIRHLPHSFHDEYGFWRLKAFFRPVI